MSDLERSEPLHVATDVASITADLKKLDQLIQEGNWIKVDGYLWALSAKYFDEKVEHGAVNFDQSLSIMQSASNCQKFLIKLREEKVKTEAQKCLSETFSQRKDQQDI